MARSPRPTADAAAQEGRARPSPIQTFRYASPREVKGPGAVVALCESDILQGAVRVLPADRSDNLHAHTAIDEFWMVLKGRARFLGPGDVLYGEFAPLDGLLIPRNTRYRVQNIGAEDLELLRVGAVDRFARDERIDDEPPARDAGRLQHLSGRVI